MLYIWIASLLGSACLSSWLADKKGYDMGNWFLLGLLFGPLALLALIGAPQREVKHG